MLRTVPIVVFALLVAGCGGDESAFSLEAGDCFQDPESFEQIQAIDVVDCANPHDNEVYLISSYPEPEEYPGDATIEQAAYTVCLEGFEDFVGAPYATSRYDIAALWPTPESWAELGDRQIVCALFDVGGERLTGSARNSGA